MPFNSAFRCEILRFIRSHYMRRTQPQFKEELFSCPLVLLFSSLSSLNFHVVGNGENNRFRRWTVKISYLDRRLSPPPPGPLRLHGPAAAVFLLRHLWLSLPFRLSCWRGVVVNETVVVFYSSRLFDFRSRMNSQCFLAIFCGSASGPSPQIPISPFFDTITWSLSCRMY